MIWLFDGDDSGWSLHGPVDEDHDLAVSDSVEIYESKAAAQDRLEEWRENDG